MVNTRAAQEADIAAMADLMFANRTADGIADEWPSIAELREMFRVLDSSRDMLLWEDEAGRLLAWAIVYMPWCNLVWYIHPTARAEALEAQLVDWAAGRVRDHNLATGEANTLDANFRDDDLYKVGFMVCHGFMLQEGHSIFMERSLDEPIAEPRFPDGIVLRPLAGEDEVEAYVGLHRAAFGTERMTVERRLAIMGDSEYIPDIDLVAVAPDGTLAGFCVCSIAHDESAGGARPQDGIDIIGTHPDWRRTGLGRALLLAGLRALKDHGASVATLGTASNNLAAQHVFEAAGFRVMYRTRWYAKEVRE